MAREGVPTGSSRGGLVMRLADFLLLHAQTVEVCLRREGSSWYPITAATLARIPAAHLAHEVMVSTALGADRGQLLVGEGYYAWRLARPDPEAIALLSLTARWRSWLRDGAPASGASSLPAPHPARAPRRAVLRAAAVLAHVFVGG